MSELMNWNTLLTNVPQLSKGAHKPGSGKLCVQVERGIAMYETFKA